MLMCGLRVRVPADLFSLKDGTIKAGGRVEGVSRRKAWSWLAAAFFFFYRTHMHVVRTAFIIPRMPSCSCSGEKTKRKKKKRQKPHGGTANESEEGKKICKSKEI